MIIFYIIASYILSWLFTWIGVKLQQKCLKQGYISKDDIFTNELKDGYFWWIVIPIINVFAGLVWMFRGIWTYFTTYGTDIVDILFGKNEK